MFHHMHGRSCGPRGGRFSRGPFSFQWEVHGEGERGGRSRRMFDGSELRLVLLKLIEEQKSEGSKKLYAITVAGKALLTEREEEVEALFARLTDLGSMRARTSGGPIRRAMGNLKAVLQQKLGAGEIDGDTLHEVAALIDEAAQKIERL